MDPKDKRFLDELLPKLRSSTVYVLWTKSHTITAATKGKLNYDLFTVKKYYIPCIYRTYSASSTSLMKNENYACKSSDKINYYMYNGNKLLPFEGISFHSSHYKPTKYYNSIIESINDIDLMVKWIYSEKLRAEMAYKTLKFIMRSGINPDKKCGRENFSKKVKENLVKRWTFNGNNTLTIKKNGIQIKLIRDVVGIYTASYNDKKKYFSDEDVIPEYNIEHVISGSYGSDGNSVENGVVLNAKVNKMKGHTILFLSNDNVMDTIRNLIDKQKVYLMRYS